MPRRETDMIYLDNAATTMPDAACVRSAEQFLKDDFYNPSALYREGFAVHKALAEARKAVLSAVAPQGYELIFTGSGTEADNQVLFSAGRRGNVVITEGEHAAVYESAKELARRGVEVRFAKLREDGSVDPEDLLAKVDADTSLVSVIHVNNETGAINEIARLSSAVKTKNKRTLFHSDGVQAFGKLDVRLPQTVDFYTISAHKIGGVRGAAALVRKKGAPLQPYLYGGGQENGLRSGTENTFAIIQFAEVVKKRMRERSALYAYAVEMNAKLRGMLDKKFFTPLSSETGSPFILSVSAVGLRGEVLQHMLNERGVLVGTGSACSSRNRYSRVILACGVGENVADGVLRLSFFGDESADDIAHAADVLNACAAELYERTR